MVQHPPMIACAGLQPDYVQRLVDAQAAPSIRNNKGRTAEGSPGGYNRGKTLPETARQSPDMLQTNGQ